MGPATAAYARDLVALETSARSDATGVDAQIQRFFAQHGVKEYLIQLIQRSLLDPANTSAMFTSRNELGYSPGEYRLYGSSSTAYEVHDYFRRLHSHAGAVSHAELTPEAARKKAARPVVTQIMGLFGGSQHAMEIANRRERRGVLVSLGSSYFEENPPERTALVSLDDYKPDTWTTFRHSWRDLATGIVLDRNHAVIGVDPFAPQKSYETVLRLLRYLREIAKAETSATPAS